ncbi:hypothetical protein REPUB_Repub04eG0167500 [Reevesia pubescens]
MWDIIMEGLLFHQRKMKQMKRYQSLNLSGQRMTKLRYKLILKQLTYFIVHSTW